VALMNGTTLTKAFVPLPGGGTAVYTASGFAYYRHADWLGSSRLASTQARTLQSSTAYAPFGEQYATSGTADPSFTGQNSDTVSSLYDFPFRRLSPSQGRWISPDPAGLAAADPTAPQTWNRYAYVANNPLSAVDPLGLYQPAPGEGGCDAESYNCAGGNGVPWNAGSSFGVGLGGMFFNAIEFNVIEYDFSGGPNFNWSNYSLAQLLQYANEGEITLIGVEPLGVVTFGGVGFGAVSDGGFGGSGSGSAAPLNGVGPNPCANANPANLNYNAVNNYISGPATALDHITQNHINSVPGKSTYWGFSFLNLGATGNMMRLNALTLTQGTLMSVSSNGAIVLSYYSPLTETQWGPFTIVQGNVGTDQNGNQTQFNTLVVKNCTVPQTSYPGLPFQP
jgi:RHS repeat-associated protein